MYGAINIELVALNRQQRTQIIETNAEEKRFTFENQKKKKQKQTANKRIGTSKHWIEYGGIIVANVSLRAMLRLQ